MSSYYLPDIDPELWRDFKALAALEGISIKDKLIGYIVSEVEFFRSAKFSKKTMDKLRGRKRRNVGSS